MWPSSVLHLPLISSIQGWKLKGLLSTLVLELGQDPTHRVVGPIEVEGRRHQVGSLLMGAGSDVAVAVIPGCL